VDRSYRPGDWFGIFGEQVTVVLPPSEKARVARIWGLVDEGAGFDEVLDALIADGLRELPGFVLVSDSDDRTQVVVRGAAHAEFTTDDETVTVEGSSVTTWAERSLSGVRAMRIDVADAGDAPDLVIRAGLVRIGRTDRPAYVDRVAEPVVEPGAERVAEPPESASEEPAGEVPLDETSYFPMPGESSPSPAGGQTLPGNWTPGDVARNRPGIPGQAPTPSALATPVASLTFSTGEVVAVDRAVVVGRAPEARHFTAGEPPRLVTVPSPHQEISSAHLEIRPGSGADHDSAVVTDLGSTNGTVLEQPGLPPEDLRPGVAVQLLPGAVIDLGDGVTILVGSA
jgi:hypothetical protein